MRTIEEKRKYRTVIVIALFVVYSFARADAIPGETVFTARWIVPVGGAAAGGAGPERVPFDLGGTFGFVDTEGAFSVVREKKAAVSLSDRLWAEYSGAPEKIAVYDNSGAPALTLEHGRGYPFFLDDKIFMVNNEQYSITRLDGSGAELWSWDFAAPLTCVDAAGGALAAGLLDGGIEVLDEGGARLFASVPAGSRVAAVYGCALSSDGTALAALFGLDMQRFLFFERSGAAWRITYHQFLEEGLRRPAYVSFVDGDRRVVFEREDGIGIYDRRERAASRVRLDGRVAALDREGAGILVLLSGDAGGKKSLVAVSYPGTVVMRAPFESRGAFLERRGDKLFVGGTDTLASFRVETR